MACLLHIKLTGSYEAKAPTRAEDHAREEKVENGNLQLQREAPTEYTGPWWGTLSSASKGKGTSLWESRYGVLYLSHPLALLNFSIPHPNCRSPASQFSLSCHLIFALLHPIFWADPIPLIRSETTAGWEERRLAWG
jgi:hypothetical protein